MTIAVQMSLSGVKSLALVSLALRRLSPVELALKVPYELPRSNAPVHLLWSLESVSLTVDP